ncbi:MAG: hypothetical protein AAF743_02595, partial [Planctomycetota bacterium]
DHLRGTLDPVRPVTVAEGLVVGLPARRNGPAGWRVAVAAVVAVAATLGVLATRSAPSGADPSQTVATRPVFVPVASQFIASGDDIGEELGVVYVDDAPMQVIRNTGLRRTEYASPDGRTRIAVVVPADDVYLTNYRVD